MRLSRFILYSSIVFLLINSILYAGPLILHPANSRYMADTSGRAILMTGAHIWTYLVDIATNDPPSAYDYGGWLTIMVTNGHNFMRIWPSTYAKYNCGSTTKYVFPTIWTRGTETSADDGKGIYTLDVLNQAYFDRLRDRVIAAGNCGIYVAVVLFEGNVKQDCTTWGWPFVTGNNDKAINLTWPQFVTIDNAAYAYQKAYIDKVADTLADLDNVVYEIGNEMHKDSQAWQAAMITYLRAHEATHAKQHLIGYSAAWTLGDTDLTINATLLASNADWIAPGHSSWAGGVVNGGDIYESNPAVNSTSGKTIILDTDHLGGTQAGDWFWKVFARGYNPIYMDGSPLGVHMPDEATETANRIAMGQILTYAKKMSLSSMVPSSSISNTTYALYNSGDEYFVYQPVTGDFTVTMVAGTYFYEWFRPSTGLVTSSGSAAYTTGSNNFSPAYYPAVLYLKKPPVTATGNIGGTVQ